VALALHELNGALSAPSGKPDAIWRIMNMRSGSRLSLEWTDPAAEPSTSSRRTRALVIEKGLPYEPGADTSVDVSPDGLRATIEIPLTERITRLGEHEEPKP